MGAYSVKKLVAKYKEHGLDLAEDAAKLAAKATLSWVKESAMESENKVDDILVPVLTMAEAPIMEALDKIDGKED